MNTPRPMNSIPAVCNKCGFTFTSPFSLGNSRNSEILDCSTNCPKCGGHARIFDSFTDSQGRLHIRDFFNYVQQLQDAKKLIELKSKLAAANDAITPVELADSLAKIEPGFENFKSVIQSIPASSLASFISNLLSIITLVIMLQTWQATEENHDETMSVQQAQFELSRKQFEYQKQQDKNNQNNQGQAEKVREEIKRQIEDLKRDFEIKLQHVEEKNSRPAQRAISMQKLKLKGNCRNKPCPCGSTKKAKKCHPNGYVQ